MGGPSAARAVGGAVGRNPIAIIVPCHRVVGSTGSLTGFGGGLDRKAWLLAHEKPDRLQFGGDVSRAG
jgi:methylated-DNA-[protein]-cysteine S-methyltransferase